MESKVDIIFKENMKICNDIKEQYKKLSLTDNGEEVFKLSQLALSMYDTLNELRFNAKNLNISGDYTKSEVREYIKSKMKLMEYIHVQCRSTILSNREDKRFSRY